MLLHSLQCWQWMKKIPIVWFHPQTSKLSRHCTCFLRREVFDYQGTKSKASKIAPHSFLHDTHTRTNSLPTLQKEKKDCLSNDMGLQTDLQSNRPALLRREVFEIAPHSFLHRHTPTLCQQHQKVKQQTFFQMKLDCKQTPPLKWTYLAKEGSFQLSKNQKQVQWNCPLKLPTRHHTNQPSANGIKGKQQTFFQMTQDRKQTPLTQMDLPA